MAVPYTFGTATASIPLSNLDSNFATTITLGNTAIQLGNTVTTLNNMTLANVTVSSGSVTLTNITATIANVTTANISGTTTLTNLTASTALALDASKNVVSVTNTGTGNNVLATSPTLVTPALGTPSSGNFSTGTFTWPTFNQNTTGNAATATSATTATNIAAGTNLQIPYNTGASSTSFIVAPTVTSTYLQYNGTGFAWATVAAAAAPAFSAYPNGTFTMSASTFTIVPCNTEEFDTNSNFNNTGSTVGSNPAYSFLPTVAGYYQINGTWSLASGTAFTRAIAAIYKNGVIIKQGLDSTTATATGSTVSAIVYLNGSTDYIGFYIFEGGSGTNTINAGPSSTYFQAAMVRSA